MFNRTRMTLAAVAGASLLALAACDDASVTANRNLDRAADNFEILRSVTFYNTWTDTPVLQVTGFCSIKDEQTKFQVTCREPDGTTTRRQMGRSPNLTYFMDQLEGTSVSDFHTRVVFRPQSILPDIDVMGSEDELLNNRNTDG